MSRTTIPLCLVLAAMPLPSPSQELAVEARDGTRTEVPVDAIRSMKFVSDGPHALVVSQADGQDTEFVLTDVRRITFDGSTAVREFRPDRGSPRPTFVLRPNYPNPFNPGTRFEVDLPASGWVQAQVFDGLGRLIRDLDSGQRQAGTHSVEWNGKDDGGRRVSSGIYFFRVRFDGSMQSRKMLLVN